ncbi:MAG TPA: pyruvate kinase [Candidatus Binatia bacterium]|nr:pyruvate kinase [Candidatus Binatia bacterium]
MARPAAKRTKIVATIGPASRDPVVLRELLRAGVNVVRLNFSHGTHDEHGKAIEETRRIARDLGIHVAVLMDLPGPKVRTGSLNGNGSGSVRLAPGSSFTLTTRQVPGDGTCVSVNYAGLPHDVEVGKRIYLADGTIALRIEGKDDSDIATRVEVGGDLRAQQGINYPEGSLSIESVTDRDLEHLKFGIEHGVDWVGVSFVRSENDVARVQEFMKNHGADIPVIAKIEKHEALENIDAIVRLSDAIMVARGDLGVEIPLEKVPLVQKDLIARANRASKPVITATQMLESMISSPRPTRAEATDVANAILDGSDAVMLSGETARGAYPVEAVNVMATIAKEVEQNYPHDELKLRRLADSEIGVAEVIAEAAARATEYLGLKLIVVGTTTGNTARYVSSFRPRARIVALTPLESVARQSALMWGVEAIVSQQYRSIETLIEIAEQRVLTEGYAHTGETIAITSGMPVGAGGTNVLKIHQIP